MWKLHLLSLLLFLCACNRETIPDENRENNNNGPEVEKIVARYPDGDLRNRSVTYYIDRSGMPAKYIITKIDSSTQSVNGLNIVMHFVNEYGYNTANNRLSYIRTTAKQKNYFSPQMPTYPQRPENYEFDLVYWNNRDFPTDLYLRAYNDTSHTILARRDSAFFRGRGFILPWPGYADYDHTRSWGFPSRTGYVQVNYSVADSMKMEQYNNEFFNWLYYNSFPVTTVLNNYWSLFDICNRNNRISYIRDRNVSREFIVNGPNIDHPVFERVVRVTHDDALHKVFSALLPPYYERDFLSHQIMNNILTSGYFNYYTQLELNTKSITDSTFDMRSGTRQFLFKFGSTTTITGYDEQNRIKTVRRTPYYEDGDRTYTIYYKN